MNYSFNPAALPIAHPFPPLAEESRPAVPIEQAAYYMHRKLQTLRKWAVYEGAGPSAPFAAIVA